MWALSNIYAPVPPRQDPTQDESGRVDFAREEEHADHNAFEFHATLRRSSFSNVTEASVVEQGLSPRLSSRLDSNSGDSLLRSKVIDTDIPTTTHLALASTQHRTVPSYVASPSTSPANMVGERIGRFSARISESIKDTIELIDDKVDKPIILNIKGIKRAGSQCHEAARETSTLCNSTVAKARDMVEFGLDIKSTLDDLGGREGGIDASTFATIQDLMDGDKIKAAMKLAGEMDELALKCVDQSVKMIDAIEVGIDELPDILEKRVDKRMDKAKEEGSREGDPELPNIDTDIEELERTIEAVRDVNLFTAMKSGRKAFDGLTSKGELCKDMFDTVRVFAEDVSAVSEAIKNFQLGNMIGKIRDLVKDIWRCLRLSDLIRSFADAVGKLIKWFIRLFKTASEKLGAVWGALAHAKDALAECARHVAQAIGLCDEAKSRSVSLVATCQEIQGHLGNITKLNQSSLVSLKDIADGDEIKLAIELASKMDDILLAAVKKIVQMINKVTKAFADLPDVIKEGLPEDATNHLFYVVDSFDSMESSTTSQRGSCPCICAKSHKRKTAKRGERRRVDQESIKSRVKRG